jgi:hypothetical protein
MVRSTTIARASDALPLAASVDDEQVSIPRRMVPVRSLSCSVDGASAARAQTAI